MQDFSKIDFNYLVDQYELLQSVQPGDLVSAEDKRKLKLVFV